MPDNDADASDLLALTADIVSAHVTNNSVAAADLPALIRSVHEALSGAGAPAAPAQPDQQPAVSIRASIKPDYIVCLEDGKKLKLLKRYLASRYGMTPAEYRAKWNLPADYPMIAPNYAEMRRGLAHSIGLGRKGGSTPKADAPSTPKPRGRPRRQPETPAEAPMNPEGGEPQA